MQFYDLRIRIAAVVSIHVHAPQRWELRYRVSDSPFYTVSELEPIASVRALRMLGWLVCFLDAGCLYASVVLRIKTALLTRRGHTVQLMRVMIDPSVRLDLMANATPLSLGYGRYSSRHRRTGENNPLRRSDLSHDNVWFILRPAPLIH